VKSPHFAALSTTPLNGAPAPAALARARVTPVADFFVRNHGDVPSLPGADHVLRVGGLVRLPVALTVAALLARPLHRVEAMLACAGNRRSELAALRPVPGELPWGHTALGNAVWEGVPLLDVLGQCGPLDGAAHVCFVGADVATEGGGKGQRFGGSIPLEHAQHALLALHMNGAPLPPAHGGPLRVVMPGYIGARSVKWLTDIVLSAEPSDNHYQRKTYRLFPPEVQDKAADPALGAMLGPLAVNSAFLTPGDGARVPAGRVEVTGWAHAGFGEPLTAVEVSADGGSTWHPAQWDGGGRGGAWVLWHCTLPLTPGRHELCCRARDGAGTQPASVDGVWNVKGYMNNAWQRAAVTVDP